jgi:hypothetical protein
MQRATSGGRIDIPFPLVYLVHVETGCNGELRRDGGLRVRHPTD